MFHFLLPHPIINHGAATSQDGPGRYKLTFIVTGIPVQTSSRIKKQKISLYHLTFICRHQCLICGKPVHKLMHQHTVWSLAQACTEWAGVLLWTHPVNECWEPWTQRAALPGPADTPGQQGPFWSTLWAVPDKWGRPTWKSTDWEEWLWLSQAYF